MSNNDEKGNLVHDVIYDDNGREMFEEKILK